MRCVITRLNCIHIFTSRVKLKPYLTETFEFSFYCIQCLVQSNSAKESIIMYAIFTISLLHGLAFEMGRQTCHMIVKVKILVTTLYDKQCLLKV